MKTDVVKYTTNEAEISKMSAIYMELTIKGIEDTEGFEAVHSAKKIMVKHRTSIDKLRKSTNKDAQEFISTNNKNAKKLTDLMEPIETHLKTEEAKITAEKERIRAEEERLEKIKIEERVTALFAVSVNIPYLEAAMLSDSEYMVKLDVATNEYNAERFRIQEEQKAKEEAEAKLEIERTAQKAEAKRLADIQAAQDKKEAELKAQAKAIEDEKKAEAERKEREAFEEKAKEEAKAKAEKAAKAQAEKLEKEREEFEKKKIANEKADRETKIQETKEARFESLKEIGFKYPFNDLGIMPDMQYIELHDSHQKVWDTKQQALLVEKLERERAEREYTEAAENKRQKALLPDQEKLMSFAVELTSLDVPNIKDAKADQILKKAETEIASIANEIIEQAKDL